MNKSEIEVLTHVLGYANKRDEDGVYVVGSPMTTTVGSRHHHAALKLERNRLVNVDIISRPYETVVRITSAVEDWKAGQTKKPLSLDDTTAEWLGQVIATNLRLKRDTEHRDRWATGWGTKTNKGLARTVLAVLTER